MSLADVRRWTTTDVQDWVESIGFQEYRSAFLEASVDGSRLLAMDVDALGAEVLLASREHAEIFAMEIAELRARRGLLSAAEGHTHRVAYPTAEAWTVAEVAGFLERSGLGRYAERFAAADVDGRVLLRLSDAEQAALLDVEPNADERNEAAAEILTALVEHLRWRAAPLLGGRFKSEL